MKITTFLSFFVLLICSLAEAQTLGRVTFSSGGTSAANQLPVSFGEVFVGGAGQVTMGSQQNSFDLPLSTADLQTNLDVQVFPNPTSGNIRVSLMQDAPRKGYVLISAANGQIVQRQHFEEQPFEVNTSPLRTGLYMLTLFNHNGDLIKTLPFIKQQITHL